VRRRFFVETFEGDRATLEGDSARHLGKVLRAERGQVYELSNGNSVRLARVEKVGRELIEFALLESIPVQAPRIESTLLLSIVKFDRFEWALEKATELGVNAIVPLAAERSEKALVAAASKRSRRWEKILLESAQQARRMKPPVLLPLAMAADHFRNSANQAGANSTPRIILSERDNAPAMRKILANFPVETARLAVLAVGPEGGWTDQECAIATSRGFHEASLGANILRTETAVAAALASINYVFG
jgi:16S rRNA (uracil1498-N3)-methyltransferase